jgi:hypothetical protein
MLFLRNADEPIFVRELTRRVDTQINAVRREVANLVALGLLIEVVAKDDVPLEPGEKKQPGLKRKYYQVNKQFPLLSEITSLMIKAQILLDRHVDQEIAKLGDVRYLAFLGAFMGESAVPVDVFIVGTLPAEPIKKLMQEAGKIVGFEINFSVITLDEFKYRKEIGDRFLHAVLEAPKKVLIDRLGDRTGVAVAV